MKRHPPPLAMSLVLREAFAEKGCIEELRENPHEGGIRALEKFVFNLIIALDKFFLLKKKSHTLPMVPKK